MTSLFKIRMESEERYLIDIPTSVQPQAARPPCRRVAATPRPSQGREGECGPPNAALKTSSNVSSLCFTTMTSKQGTDSMSTAASLSALFLGSRRRRAVESRRRIALLRAL